MCRSESDQLTPDVTAIPQHDVGEQPSVSVASGLGPITKQPNGTTAGEHLHGRRRLCGEALTYFRRVDPDEPDSIIPSVIAHDDGVPIDNPRDARSYREARSRRC